jgi:hypothetical protein
MSKTHKHSITPAQAEFLNSLARAAHNYKRACEQISADALRDAETLNKAAGVRGPNHQTVSEYVRYFGEYKALEGAAHLMFEWPEFKPQDEEAEKVRQEAIKHFEDLIALAVQDPENDYSPYYFLPESN